MTLGALVLLALLVALAIIAALAGVRVLRTLRRGRELARFQDASSALLARLGEQATPLLRDIDELLRQTADPGAAAARLRAAGPSLLALSQEARGGLHAPPGFEPMGIAIAGAIARAARSVDLARDGAETLANARSGAEVAASTVFKRAGLNLRHAVDEADRVGRRIATLEAADLDRPAAAAGSVSAASLAIYGDIDDDRPIGE